MTVRNDTLFFSVVPKQAPILLAWGTTAATQVQAIQKVEPRIEASSTGLELHPVDAHAPVSIRIFDMRGKLALSKMTLQGRDIQVGLNLSSGTYEVVLEQSMNRYSKKVAIR